MKLLINKEGFFGFQLKPEDFQDKIAYVILRVMYMLLLCWCVLHLAPFVFIWALDLIFSNTIRVHVPYNWYTWTATIFFFAWVYFHDIAHRSR